MIPYNYFLQQHDDPESPISPLRIACNVFTYICTITTGLLVVYSFFLWLLSLDSVLWSILIPILSGLRVLCVVYYYRAMRGIKNDIVEIVFPSLSILYSDVILYLLIRFAPPSANTIITPMFIDAVPHIILCVLLILRALNEGTKNEGMYYKVPNHEGINYVFPVVQLIQT